MDQKEDWGWFIDTEDQINNLVPGYSEAPIIQKNVYHDNYDLYENDKYAASTLDYICKTSIIIMVSAYIYFKLA
jgi:hypothetical protein